MDLDGVATAPALPEVVDAMLPWLRDRRANPASRHPPGLEARRALERARAEVAALVGASPTGVTFTSGVTEANNLAVRGAAELARRAGRRTLAVPSHDHPSLLHPGRALARGPFRLVELAVGLDGRVDPRSVDAADAFVALAHAHAELGTLQPVPEIVRRARLGGARVVVDATLTAGRIPLATAGEDTPDVVTLSFHHFGGPMGVGAAVTFGETSLPPLLHGGTQEGGVRPGTPNLAGCVGAGMAALRAREHAEERRARLDRQGRRLAEGLASVPGVMRTGASLDARLPGHVSAAVAGIDGEALVVALADRGILAATGSPCADEAGLASAALRAAGYADDEARGAVVLCVPPTGAFPDDGVERTVRAFRDAVGALRRLAGDVARARS